MNRNKLMALNAMVVLFTTLLNMVLAFSETKLFIYHYGSEINGLIQSGNQILNYLVLLEGGLCSSYMYHMYQVVASQDASLLSAYYRGFQKNIQNVVIKMMIVALAISAIYPLFIKETKISYFYMFSIFALLAAKVIMPYQVTLVPKHMIILKEQKFLAELIAGLTTATIYLTEILVIQYTSFSLQILLLICIGISLASGLLYRRIMSKMYMNSLDKNATPDLKPNKMSKDVLAHTISGLVFGNTDNVILSVLSSLHDVTIYSNYMMITRNFWALVTKLFDGATASLGIKIANKDQNSYKVFKEILSISLLIAVVAPTVYIIMINDFIELWVGQKYCVSFSNVILFAVILYCNIILGALQPIIAASGRYKESKRYTITQAIVNLVITISLVPSLGITGALIGTAFARAFISIPFNYRTIYKYVFTKEKKEIAHFAISTLLIATLCLFTHFTIKMIPGINGEVLSWRLFVFKACIVTVITATIAVSVFTLTNSGFRSFINRVKQFVIK